MSSKLSLYFADLDDLILRDAQKFTTIRELYSVLGSDGFQKREFESLSHFIEINRAKSFVLSLGGGTIENESAIELLDQSDVQTFYLDADMSALYGRIIRGGIPPFLKGDDPFKNFEGMYKKRSELYGNWAGVTVNTRGLNPLEIADIIKQQIN